jgi:group I intron endonuclease
VYRWVNLVNNKTYIGSSINFSVRLYKYYSLKHLIENKTPIHNALVKYGYSKFKLEILEYCNINNVILREQYYFDHLKPEYNILEKAGSSLGFKHNEKTLNFFRDERKVSEVTKKNLSLAATGRILSEEDKDKLSNKRKGIKLSEETKAKISASTISLIGVSVLVKNINTQVETEYKSLTEAAKAISVSRTAVSKAMSTGKILKKFYIITKKEINK